MESKTRPLRPRELAALLLVYVKPRTPNEINKLIVDGYPWDIENENDVLTRNNFWTWSLNKEAQTDYILSITENGKQLVKYLLKNLSKWRLHNLYYKCTPAAVKEISQIIDEFKYWE